MTPSTTEEIKSKLSNHLYNTTWTPPQYVEGRVINLMKIHNTYIQLAIDKLTTDEIALNLFQYEKNIKLRG